MSSPVAASLRRVLSARLEPGPVNLMGELVSSEAVMMVGPTVTPDPMCGVWVAQVRA